MPFSAFRWQHGSQIGDGESFKITFLIAHWIAEQILWMVECNQIAICLNLLAMNLNTYKPIHIWIRPNISLSVKNWDITICKFSYVFAITLLASYFTIFTFTFYIVLMKILFAVNWKQSSFCPSADVKPMENDLVHEYVLAVNICSLYVYLQSLSDHLQPYFLWQLKLLWSWKCKLIWYSRRKNCVTHLKDSVKNTELKRRWRRRKENQ
jgi:hypothetical protein